MRNKINAFLVDLEKISNKHNVVISSEISALVLSDEPAGAVTTIEPSMHNIRYVLNSGLSKELNFSFRYLYLDNPVKKKNGV